MSNMPPSPSDDQFDQFLQDTASETAPRLDTRKTIDNYNVHFDAICDEAGYVPLLENNARSHATQQDLEDFIREQLAQSDAAEEFNDEYIYDAALNLHKIVGMREGFAIIQIKMLGLGETGQKLVGEFDLDQATHRKSQLFARLILQESFSTNDPVIAVLNRAVPGKEMSVDDPELTPYFLEVVEAMANEPEKDTRHEQELNEVLTYLGINIDDYTDDTLHARRVVTTMVKIIGRVNSDSPNAAANREDRLRSFARNQNLDTALADRVIAYMEQQYPL